MEQNSLLTRDQFRNAVFERDNHKCVICGEPGVDSHHILERRLFHDYGYYIDNGSTLCTKHHLEAEMTTLGCDEIRKACGIKKIILPDHLYDDQEYDKWGNCILTNGTRTKGDLFEDESVQKILGKGKVLDLFTDVIKYPRTYHLEWSPGITRDDRIMPGGSSANFEGKEVIIFEKLDGENCLSENSLLITEFDGKKTIRWICETKYNGRVLCYDIDKKAEIFSKVINWSILENNDDWYELTLDDDRTIILTSNHKVWLTVDKCYRLVSDLKINDDFLLRKDC